MDRLRILAWCVAWVACGGRGPDTGERCAWLASRNDPAAAVAVCEQAFDRGGDPEHGFAAARAHYALDHGDDVMRLAQRLTGGRRAASAYHLMGRVHLMRGEREAAWADLRKAIALRADTADHAGAVADSVVLVGSYRAAGRYREALALVATAAAAAEAARDPDNRAWALTSRADILVELGADREAAALFREARLLIGAGDPRHASIGNSQGVLEVAAGNVALAAELFIEARDEAARLGETEILTAARINLSDVRIRQGDLDAAARELAAERAAAGAEHMVSRAVPFNEALIALARGQVEVATTALAESAAAPEHPEWQWQLEQLRGQIEERRGQLDAAVAAYRRSIAAVEALRADLGAGELRASFLDERRAPYEALFALAARRGDPVAAVAAAELVQARTFVDAFITTMVAPVQGDGGSSDVVARVDALRALVPAADERSRAEPAIGEVLAAIRDDHVVTYVETGSAVWAIAIERGRPRLVALAVGLAELRARIDQLIAHPDDDVPAAELGALLLPRTLGPLRARTTYVVPSAAMARLPFALLRRDGARLVDHTQLAYLPSISTLVRIRRRAAAVGDSVGPAAVIGDGRGDLPGAAREARLVAALLGVREQVGRDATVSRLRDAHRASVLHVATHAGIDRRGGWLALADGDVRAEQILAWNLQPRTVVLASCNSAATPRREYWGSLTAAFLAAGSRAVVSTLWSVDDRPTAALIDAFYAAGGATAPAEALARAQRLLARTQPAAVWSAFVVAGTDDAVPTRKPKERR